MFRTAFGLCVVVASLFPSFAAAQPAADAPSVLAAQSNADELYGDLKFILESAQEPKAYKLLADTLDVLLDGVDRKKPIIFRTEIQKGRFTSAFFVPVVNVKVFLDNLKNSGIKTKPVPGQKDLYKATGIWVGHVRIAGTTAVFGETQADVPTTITPPTAAAQKLLGGKYRFATQIVGVAQGSADRKKAFDIAAQEIKAGIVQRKEKGKEESTEAFNLRKQTAEQQLAEFERFYVESAHILLGWTLSTQTKKGELYTELSALPSTSLAASVDLIGKSPSYFANIKMDTSAPLSGFINFPLEDMRKKHLKEFIKLSKPLAAKKIQEGKVPDANKKYDEQAMNLAYDVLDKSVDAGLFDGFIDVKPASGGLYSVIGGLRLPSDWVKDSLTAMKNGDNIQLSVEKAGEVDIHKVALPPDQPELRDLFGKESVLYVGTSSKALWYAIGEKALDRMKEAIALVEKPVDGKPDMAAGAVHMKLALWAEYADKWQTRLKIGDAKLRASALGLIKGKDDSLSYRLERVDNKVIGRLNVNEGVLLYVGKLMGKFINENF